MEINSLMMISFFLLLGLTSWKLYSFLPNEPLKDDDTNPESVAELEKIMILCISKPSITERELFESMIKHEAFDKEHYWRFNENRLKHLLHTYLIKNREYTSIEDIYISNELKKTTDS